MEIVDPGECSSMRSVGNAAVTCGKEGGWREVANVSNGDKKELKSFTLSWLLILRLARDESDRRTGRMNRFVSM